MKDSPDLDKLKRVAEAAVGKLATNVVALDVREVVSFADALVIASGRSDRQVRAIADAIQESVDSSRDPVLGVEGYTDGRWVLIDLADVVVHVFQDEVRGHYDLERLWSDAVPIDLGLEEAPETRHVVP